MFVARLNVDNLWRYVILAICGTIECWLLVAPWFLAICDTIVIDHLRRDLTLPISYLRRDCCWPDEALDYINVSLEYVFVSRILVGSLGIFSLGSFAWELSFGIFRLELSLGIIRLGSVVWVWNQLQVQCHLGINCRFVWIQVRPSSLGNLVMYFIGTVRVPFGQFGANCPGKY